MQAQQISPVPHTILAVAATKPSFGKLNMALLIFFSLIGMALAGLTQERVGKDLKTAEDMIAQLKTNGVNAAEVNEATTGAASFISRVRMGFNGTVVIVVLALASIVLAAAKKPAVAYAGMALIALAVVGAFLYPAGGGGEFAGASFRKLGFALAVPFALAGLFAALGGRRLRRRTA